MILRYTFELLHFCFLIYKGYSQRSKKFLAPAQKLFHNPNENVQGQTVKSYELKESVLWTHEPSRERNQAVGMKGFVESRPLPTASAPPFKTR